ncbi:MAG: hypothetical protein ACI8XZ_003224, partial [Gammaproteobacteria bacterium]
MNVLAGRGTLRSCAGQLKAFVTVTRDFVAFIAIDAAATNVGHKQARFARHVRAHIPG